MQACWQLARVVAVIGLLVAAALVVTPPGRLPLALRGLRKVMRRDAGAAPDKDLSASPLRRFAAFLLAAAAAVVAAL